MKKRFVWLFAVAVFLAVGVTGGQMRVPVHAAQAEVSAVVREIAEGIIGWKKSDVGSTPDGYLINDTFLKQAGTTPGDWFPIGLGRLGVADNQPGYLAVISDNVQKRYDTPEKLDAAKATEWHRISLAVLASGGNPRAMGEDRNGDGRGDIDLIADGTYNRVNQNGVGILPAQGINGFIWGLIALDSMFYEVPESAFYSRDDIICSILSEQLADGGWALTNGTSDPDITAMAIQSLAPYYNSEKEYSYVNRYSGEQLAKKVRTAVEEALDWLSSVQLPDGDFKSWGTENAESTCQVTVALASLGIDPLRDERFVTVTGKTLLDGILKYRLENGGFIHSAVYDPSNPTSKPDEANTMASEQALYTMAALIRVLEGDRRLYDFRPEQSESLRSQIAEAEMQIALLTPDSDSEELRRVYAEYLEIDAAERSYVKNYAKLSGLLSFAGIEYEKEEIEYNSGDAGITTPTEYFNEADQAAVNALPKKLTTAYRAEVLRLWNKINNSIDFEGKDEMTIQLEKAKNEIDGILAEIDDIKAEIKEQLYPFDWIGLNKRDAVHALYDRYLSLSEYDRAQFETSDIEGLLKCKTQVDNLLTALIVGVVCAVAAAGIVVFVVLHVKKRRRLKAANAMQESDE